MRHFLIFLSLFLLFVSCNIGKKVKLVHHNFEDEIELQQNLLFSFSHDLAPDSMVNQWDTNAYVHIRPAVKGLFKWISKRDLIFSPESGFLPATNYSAVFSPDLTKRIPAGFSLENTEKFSFHTPYLECVLAEALWMPSASGASGKALAVNLRFNYTVDPQTIKKYIVLKIDNKNTNFRMHTSEQGEEQQLRVEGLDFSADRKLNLSLTLLKDCPTLAGPGKTAMDQTLTFSCEAPGNLVIHRAEATFEGTDPVISLFSNQAISTEQPQKCIQLEPAMPFELSHTTSGIQIKAAFVPGLSYQILVSKELKGFTGKSMANDFNQMVSFGELEPSVSFVNGRGQYLSSQVAPNLAVNITSVKEVHLTITRIYENNILPFLRNRRYMSYDYQTGSYGTPSYQTYGLDEYGDQLTDRIYQVRDLPKVKGRHLLNFQIDKDPDFKGVYVVEVADESQRWLKAVKLIAVSDVGIIAKKGRDEIFVFVNSLKTTDAVSGASVSFYTYHNQLLKTLNSNAEGVVSLNIDPQPAPGKALELITVRKGQDFNFLHLGDSRVEDSRSDVGGRREISGGYMAFLYGDRNLYRPGEKVVVNTIIRNKEKAPVSAMPFRIKIKSPNGSVFREFSKKTGTQGAADISFDMPESAITGTWFAEAWSANGILLETYSFSVEEFMPERLSVKLKLDKESYQAKNNATLSVEAMNLYGTPAASRNYDISYYANPQTFSSTAFPDYSFSLSIPDFVNLSSNDRSGSTDAEGKAKEEFSLSDYEGIGLIQAEFFCAVFDENGRSVNRRISAPLHTQDRYVGIGEIPGYVGVGERVGIPLIMVNAQGKAINGKAQLKVINREWHSVIERSDDGTFRYVSQKKETEVLNQEVVLGLKGHEIAFYPRISGEYEIRVQIEGYDSWLTAGFYSYGSGATTNTAFEVNPEGQVLIEPDKQEYEAGEKAKVLFKTPFSGKMLVTLESDKVIRHYYLKTEKKSAFLEIPLDASMLPNVYVTATLFRAVDDGSNPLWVAHGFIPLKIKSKATELPLKILASASSGSNTKQTIRIQAGGLSDVELSIAVVDEGILQMKHYETPNPHAFFYQKRALEVSTHDMYKWVLPDLKLRRSSTGGDGYMMARRMNPFGNKRIDLVAFWSGVVKTNASGEAVYEIQIPQFAGDLRIMACAWQNNKFGSAEAHMKVADPLIVSAGIPRFISPADKFEMPVTLSNTTKKDMNVEVRMLLEGPLESKEGGMRSVRVPAGKEQRLMYNLGALSSPGLASIRIEANAGGKKYSEFTRLTVRPAAGLVKETDNGMIPAGGSRELRFNGSYLPGTLESDMLLTGNPAGELGHLLDQLVEYPHGCLEQTISVAFPQLYVADLLKTESAVRARAGDPVQHIKAAIKKVESMQTYNGAFLYWMGGNEESWWGTAFAVHFLNEAGKAGYEVNEQVSERAQSYLREKVRSREMETAWFSKGNQTVSMNLAKREIAYSLYVLASLHKQDMATMNYYKANHALLSDDSRCLLACAYLAAGDRASYNALMNKPESGMESVRAFAGSFYSPLRDQALMLNAILETDPTRPDVGEMVKHLSAMLRGESWISTSEAGFAFLALGKFSRMSGAKDVAYSLNQNGKLNAYKGTQRFSGTSTASKQVSISNTGKSPLYFFRTVSGTSADGKVKEEDRHLMARRTFYTRNGKPAGNTFQQGELLVVKLSLKNTERGDVPNVVLSDLLPAGFEIENPRLTGGQQLPWIKDQSEAEHFDIRDDRINYFTTASGTERYFYYMVRAVTAGTFRLPPVSADAMYDGDYHSYANSGYISIVSGKNEVVAGR
ncbi:MAG: hypothetical protein RLZZ46_1581 [Bacteroidota bacterium]|jgi:uncharacterized protein YfaS (alpha-2-macroglobulin family)